MCDEIQKACREQGMPIPQTSASIARTIFDSLALLYQQTLGLLEKLYAKKIKRLHIVGGGDVKTLFLTNSVPMLVRYLSMLG